MVDGDKRCGCGQGCPTFGACIRSKGLTYSVGLASDFIKDWDRTLDRFDNCVLNHGVTPASTQHKDVVAAEQKIRTLKD